MLYKLKELNYVIKPDKTTEVTTPTHKYVIRYDNDEKRYQVRYHELNSNQVGYTWCKSYSECKEWIEKVHLPAKLGQFFHTIVDKKPTEAMLNKGLAYINNLTDPPKTPVFIEELFKAMLTK